MTKPPNNTASISDVLKRLRRLESRLVQLMIHMGLNPYSKQYEDNDVPADKRNEKDQHDRH